MQVSLQQGEDPDETENETCVSTILAGVGSKILESYQVICFSYIFKI